MTTAPQVGSPRPGPGISTLRSLLSAPASNKPAFDYQQAVGLLVPLAVELAELHRLGHRLLVHPSSVRLMRGELGIVAELAQGLPQAAEDLACLPPEVRKGGEGDARASIFSLGAILYELVTGEHVGPGMRRPSDLVADIPPELEVVLSRALIADPQHRPEDLNALAQALHGLSPKHSAMPPPADPNGLAGDERLEVDVSLSMLPPPPRPGVANPYEMQVRAAPAPLPSRPRDDASNELSNLKARLEADPRPRYVVVKQGMDHGPFTAVELLQQIASHTFTEDDVLRDSLGGTEKSIQEFPEFAPFADHARRHRDIKAEKAAIDRVVVQEARSTRGKAFLGVAALGALLVAATGWYMTSRGERRDTIDVQEASLSTVETDASLAAARKTGGSKAGGVVGRQGNFPILGGGMSCEAAQAAYVEEMNIGGKRGPADLSAGQYGSILNSGAYFSHCGIPDSMSLSICAAVQNGRAVGVSVSTRPADPAKQSCVSQAVRRLSFPSHPKLDVTRTNF
jgi:hypothetical protein